MRRLLASGLALALAAVAVTALEAVMNSIRKGLGMRKTWTATTTGRL